VFSSCRNHAAHAIEAAAWNPRFAVHYVFGAQNYPAPFIPSFRPLIVTWAQTGLKYTIHIARAIHLGLNSPQARLYNKGA